MFCHRYPTRRCVAGDGGVLSAWDTCSLILRDGNLIARSGCDCQHQGGWEPGLSGTVNTL